MKSFHSFFSLCHPFEWMLDLDHSSSSQNPPSLMLSGKEWRSLTWTSPCVFAQIGLRKGLDTSSYRKTVAAKTSDQIVAPMVGASNLPDLLPHLC